MAEVKWIKLFVDIWDNRKIRQIETLPDGDTVLIIWLKLLTLAGNINNDGFVYFTKDIPFSDEMLAAHFGKPLNTVKMALEVFQRFGMIEIVNEIIRVSNWEKYQNKQRLDDLKEYNRIKQREHRERVNEMSMLSIDSQDIERRKKIEEEEKKIEEKKSVARFTPPTRAEVDAYCAERYISIDVERFLDYYESNGWKVGKNKMKDWKATVRNWARKDNETKNNAFNVDIRGKEEEWI